MKKLAGEPRGALKMWMPLAGRSRGGESRCHPGYTGHFSLIGTPDAAQRAL
jgi:hypothetical protein